MVFELMQRGIQDMLEQENIPGLTFCLIQINVHLFLISELFNSLINNMDNVLREHAYSIY